MLVLEPGVGDVETLRFSPDGCFLTVGGRKRFLETWTASHPERVSRIRLPGRAIMVRYHPHLPMMFAVIGSDAWVLALNADEPRLVQTIQSYCSRFDLSGDGRALVLSGRLTLSMNGERTAVFDIDGEKPVTRRWAEGNDQGGTHHWGLVWLLNCKQFALAEWIGHYPNHSARIVIRDCVTGEILQAQLRQGLPYDQLALSSDGLLVAFSKGMISAWRDADLSRDPHVIRNDNRKHFTAIAFHPSGRYLAATSNDQTVKLYDTETWQLAKTFTWDIGRMRSIAFSPDGMLAAAGSGSGKVVVWDVDL